MTRQTQRGLRLAGVLVICASLGGCLVVSYSSQSGWWVRPGSLVVTLLLFLAWFLSRR
jgi:hypothetical protein